jgi:polar amino acid transport system substrate-binding protein
MKWLLCLLIFICPLTVTAHQKVRLTNGEWPPYLSEHLPHHGCASHIVKEAFSAVGIEIEYGFFPWQRSYEYAKNGKDPSGQIWHGSLVWVPTENRTRHFLYTDAVVTDHEVLFHLKNRSLEWNEISDLQGKTIGGTQHTVYPNLEEADRRGILHLEKSGTYETLFKRLLLQRIDAVPHVKNVAQYLLRTSLTQYERSQITFSPTVLQKREYHVILTKRLEKNKELIQLFNKGLKIIKENGKYYEYFHNLSVGKYDSSD